MWIKRHLEKSWSYLGRQPVKFLVGQRQSGKSSLLEELTQNEFTILSLDDLQNRTLAQTDPGLFLETHSGNLVVDEAQYAPNLFPELKRQVDLQKSKKVKPRLFWMSGSNQIVLNKNIRESLAGRASYARLHPLSVAELVDFQPDFEIKKMFLFGGWPELYAEDFSPMEAMRHLNDYLQLVLERDIVQAAGIQKVSQFLKTTQLLAGRAANVLDVSNIASDSGVQASTVSDWLSALEQMFVISRLPTFSTNLNTRMIKAPKVFFLDNGLLSRLQGWQAVDPLLSSPLIGGAFENLVYTEIVKTRDHFLKDWKISYFRTKDGEEIDFVVEGNGKYLLLECKFASQSAVALRIPNSAKKVFGEESVIHVVTFGGEQKALSERGFQIPIKNLKDFLLNSLS